MPTRPRIDCSACTNMQVHKTEVANDYEATLVAT